MQAELGRAVERVIGSHTQRPALIRDTRAVGGGCINQTFVVQLSDGRNYFVKANADPLDNMFAREAAGLSALAEAGTIRVPVPVGHGGGAAGVPPFLVMEYIASARPGNAYGQMLGQGLAELHLRTRSKRCGFSHDNYLGSSVQPNAWTSDWVVFWREHRLGHQLELARHNGLCDSEMARLGNALLARLPELIADPDEPPCLLHGDLWGGNHMADERGCPVLIDPACYYGRREADLAMTLVFGGFDSSFYQAYEQTWPLAPGSEERLEIYKLYHLLNHLNLFGSSYRGACMQILRRHGSA